MSKISRLKTFQISALADLTLLRADLSGKALKMRAGLTFHGSKKVPVDVARLFPLQLTLELPSEVSATAKWELTT